jgi:uncharacterized protein YoaH (UPF0181 family)
MIRWSAAAIAFVILGLPAWAGPSEPAAPPSDREVGSGTTATLPSNWSIREEVSKIENHMRGFLDLSESLGSASQELAQDFEAYLQDPKNEVLASSIEKKMALFADQVVHDFDRVITDQDVLVSNFKELKRKLQKFDGALGEKVSEYDLKMALIRDEASKIEQGLIAMAIKIKEARDPAEKKALESVFAKDYRRFRLKNRNIRGFEHNLQNYKVLVKNLQLLNQLFGQLQDKFVDLMQNLENEKAYLLDSIELQQDSVKIKKIMNEGFFSGERAIKNVTEKMAQLYHKVDAFTQVHDRINQGLGRFLETQDTLQKLSATIDEIGNDGITGEGGPLTSSEAGGNGIDAAIEYFYKQRGKLGATGSN